MSDANTVGELMTTPTLTIDGARAIVRLNRPRHHNRLEPADLVTLMALMDEIDANDDVRVMVLTASGKSFSAGFHIGAIEQRRDGDARGGNRDTFEHMTNRVEAVRVPTICALNGSIYGGATDLALACDFRIGVLGMRFVMPAGRLGVHYYPSGMQRYVTRLGLATAKKMFLTAEPMEVDEMLRVGFLDEAVAPEDLEIRVDELATRIAGNAPLSLRGMKRALNDIARGELDHERIRAARAFCENSEDVAEGVAAWSERRPPVFKGR